MARGALKISVRELGESSGVSFVSISRFENEKSGLQHASAEAIRKALEAQGIEFIPENGGGPGVRLAKNEGKK